MNSRSRHRSGGISDQNNPSTHSSGAEGLAKTAISKGALHNYFYTYMRRKKE